MPSVSRLNSRALPCNGAMIELSTELNRDYLGKRHLYPYFKCTPDTQLHCVGPDQFSRQSFLIIVV